MSNNDNSGKIRNWVIIVIMVGSIVVNYVINWATTQNAVTYLKECVVELKAQDKCFLEDLGILNEKLNLNKESSLANRVEIDQNEKRLERIENKGYELSG